MITGGNAGKTRRTTTSLHDAARDRRLFGTPAPPLSSHSYKLTMGRSSKPDSRILGDYRVEAEPVTSKREDSSHARLLRYPRRFSAGRT